MFTSIVSAPMSRLLFFTAFITSITDTLNEYIASGFSSIWYSLTNPPADATSDTPSAADNEYFT